MFDIGEKLIEITRSLQSYRKSKKWAHITVSDWRHNKPRNRTSVI